ncbi:methyltransferase [Flavobacteriaceae bacterium Ap0902]|nr:methyltransferase [Flavobacteriaceae bacterium Ap0902]
MFKFKQFQIQQQNAAAKVGTDGVLLGAWVDLIPKPATILDIGTGTGLIALMLAQRSPNSQITAIEIDDRAYKQAQFNFEHSPWAHHLRVLHTALQDYTPSTKYDLIISNPPFYKEDVLSKNQRRDKARNVKHLPFDLLIKKSVSLLSHKGQLAVIIPYDSEQPFIDLSKRHNLYPIEVCRVKGNPKAPVKRSLLLFGKNESNVNSHELIIEELRHVYTSDYINLTKDFYLNM